MTDSRMPTDHIADLRSALERAVRLLAFAAGREAATDPAYAERLLTDTEDMKAVLIRTDPAQAPA